MRVLISASYYKSIMKILKKVIGTCHSVTQKITMSLELVTKSLFQVPCLYLSHQCLALPKLLFIIKIDKNKKHFIAYSVFDDHLYEIYTILKN